MLDHALLQSAAVVAAKVSLGSRLMVDRDLRSAELCTLGLGALTEPFCQRVMSQFDSVINRLSIKKFTIDVMNPSTTPLEVNWRPLARMVNRQQAAVVGMLSLATAATEGLGLILLAPMLQALGDGSAQSSALSFPAASLGVPSSLTGLAEIADRVVQLECGRIVG